MYNHYSNPSHPSHGHLSGHPPPPPAPQHAPHSHLPYQQGYYYPGSPYGYPPAPGAGPQGAPISGGLPPPPPPPPHGAPATADQHSLQHPSAMVATGPVGAGGGTMSSKTGSRRGPWSPLEDKKLLDLIAVFGPTNWVRISNSLATRTPKQCRERFHQNLKPSLNRAPISVEEGELIESLVAKYGKKWAEISRHMNGRSDNAIKNWWNGGANRRRRASQTPAHAAAAAAAATAADATAAGAAAADDAATAADEKPSRKASVSVPKAEFVEPAHKNSSASSLKSNASSGAPAASGPAPSGISFNTSMFGKSESTLPPVSPYKTGSTNSGATTSRSASFDFSSGAPITAPFSSGPSNLTLPPITSSNKRRLLDDPISRRHSTANSAVYANHYSGGLLTSSHPNLSSIISSQNNPNQPGNLSPSYHGSPLLLSTQASRNNSISFEFSALNSTASTSRRSSSIAPDLFPNPLKDASNSHKRNVSQNSSFNSPCITPSTRFSVSSNTSVLNPSHGKEEELTHKRPKDHDGSDHDMDSNHSDDKSSTPGKTKISVSSLIS